MFSLIGRHLPERQARPRGGRDEAKMDGDLREVVALGNLPGHAPPEGRGHLGRAGLQPTHELLPPQRPGKNFRT